MNHVKYVRSLSHEQLATYYRDVYEIAKESKTPETLIRWSDCREEVDERIKKEEVK